MTGVLVCPGCGAEHPDRERFCGACGLPLVHGELPVLDERRDMRRDQARKIKPQLAEGRLVRVVGARNQTEAEFIQGLLLEEGVPSLVRRSAGFDVPDMLAAGPRDVLVPQSGLITAREVLLEAEILDAGTAPVARVSPGRLLGGLLAALVLGMLVVWLLSRAVG